VFRRQISAAIRSCAKHEVEGGSKKEKFGSAKPLRSTLNVHSLDQRLHATGFLSSQFESLAVAQFTRRGWHPLQPDSFILLSAPDGE
jgi:hypothetical protein